MGTTSDERRDIAESLRYMNRYERICYKEQFYAYGVDNEPNPKEN